MRRSDLVVCAGVAFALSQGCADDPPSSPTAGILEVTLLTTGDDIDADGYVVSIDGGNHRSVAANGTIAIPGLAAGVRNVELEGLATNCTVEGGAVRAVTVIGGEVARLTFYVNCQSLVGTLSVSTITSGTDVDPNGYAIHLHPVSPDQGVDRIQSIGANASFTFSALASGQYVLELDDVADNCTVAADNPRTVTVTGGNTTVTAFNVACDPLVPLELTGRIVFESDRDGNVEVYIMNADGSSQTRLTNNPAYDGVPAMSPDGTKILFETSREGNQEIFVMNADGSAQTNLTRHAAWDERPNWSPDGTRILFVSDRDGLPDIFVMNADGSGLVNLTASPTSIDRPAAWSPDGTRITFASSRHGAFQIFVMNADGSSPVQLTDTPSADFSPAWSPDGTRIAFTSNPTAPSDEGDIHVINADGSGRVNLTKDPTTRNRFPNWSPDGSLIAFTTYRAGNYEVFVMKADGSHPVNVSRRPQSADRAGWSQSWDGEPTSFQLRSDSPRVRATPRTVRR
ncbi:MAG TPA: hypothetical protein VFZ73_12380 [Gemmatimonadaceae bacterium]